jgi:hypothetical protein
VRGAARAARLPLPPTHLPPPLTRRPPARRSALRDAVVAGAFPLDAALANAAMVAGPLALHAAAHAALSLDARGARRTRSLHAELLVALSGSRHIGEALSRFGVGPAARHVLAARFDAAPGDAAALRAAVGGAPAPLAALAELTDAAAVQRAYKATDAELGVGSLEEAAAARVAARECG